METENPTAEAMDFSLVTRLLGIKFKFSYFRRSYICQKEGRSFMTTWQPAVSVSSKISLIFIRRQSQNSNLICPLSTIFFLFYRVHFILDSSAFTSIWRSIFRPAHHVKMKRQMRSVFRIKIKKILPATIGQGDWMPGKKIVLPSYWTNVPDRICFGVQRNI